MRNGTDRDGWDGMEWDRGDLKEIHGACHAGGRGPLRIRHGGEDLKVAGPDDPIGITGFGGDLVREVRATFACYRGHRQRRGVEVGRGGRMRRRQRAWRGRERVLSLPCSRARSRGRRRGRGGVGVRVGIIARGGMGGGLAHSGISHGYLARVFPRIIRGQVEEIRNLEDGCHIAASVAVVWCGPYGDNLIIVHEFA